MSKPIKTVLALAALAIVAYSASVKLARLEQIAQKTFAFQVGEMLPDFQLNSFDGSPRSLYAELENYEVVVVNYWATWCPPCKLELPGFIRDYELLAPAGHMQILAVSAEPVEDLKPFLAQMPLPFPVLLDPEGELGRTHGVAALPTTIIVGDGGKILGVGAGVFPNLGGRVRTALKLPEEGTR